MAVSAYTDFEDFDPVPGTRKRYRMKASARWDVGIKGSGWVLIIASGTEFDLSVPRWLEWALSPHNRRWLPAAAIHDELLNRRHDESFAAAEFRRAVASRAGRDWRIWPAFFLVLIYTTATARSRR